MLKTTKQKDIHRFLGNTKVNFLYKKHNSFIYLEENSRHFGMPNSEVNLENLENLENLVNSEIYDEVFGKNS